MNTTFASMKTTMGDIIFNDNLDNLGQPYLTHRLRGFILAQPRVVPSCPSCR